MCKVRAERKKPTIRIQLEDNGVNPRRDQTYTGWYNESGRRVVCQGPHSPLLRDPIEYPDPEIERPLWHVVKRWSATVEQYPLLSKFDAVCYMRMRRISETKKASEEGVPPPFFPDWHKIGDWMRAWMREESYKTVGKGHFHRAPPVINLVDSEHEDGLTAEEKLDYLASLQSKTYYARQRHGAINEAKREGRGEESRLFQMAVSQPKGGYGLTPEEHHELEDRCRRDANSERSETEKTQIWFFQGVFWNYLNADPFLKAQCKDIAETKTWHERAKRWGFATRGGAQKHAHNALKQRLLTVSDGKAVKVLLQLMRVLGVPTMIGGNSRDEGPREVYKNNRTLGRSMRFCERCGVAMGIMNQREYLRKYKEHAGLCPICKKPAI
jgi:hypothetical protein